MGDTPFEGHTVHRELTRELARFAVQSDFAGLPHHVQTEATRAFLNWLGCCFGGCREPAAKIAAATVTAAGGYPQASIIGHQPRTDVASAAFVNCISSSVQAFDDAHLATVTHPSSPVASALLAFSENTTVSGEEFLNALALGIEITCRLSNALLLPPAKFNLGFYVTGLSAPVGAAVAVGRLLKLDEQRMNWAIGLAASQSSGFRSTQGTMTAHFRSGHVSRGGVLAAELAARGFDSADDALEARKGFMDVFSAGADMNRATDGLGRHFELLSNTYKPYPCGIVIHPTIDACLEIRDQIRPHAGIAKVMLRVNPMALFLTDKREPRNRLELIVSIYHWTAAALVRGSAGLAESDQACIDDPAVAALRARVQATADAQIREDEAIVEVVHADGATNRSHVVNARGSLSRPMTDAELDAKFRAQVGVILSPEATEELLGQSRRLASAGDVGKSISEIWRA